MPVVGELWRPTDVLGLGGAVGLAIAGGMVAYFYDSAGLADSGHWFVVAAIVTGVLVGGAVPAFRRMASVAGVGSGALVVALAGTYLCVPETDQFWSWRVLALPIGVFVVELVTRRPLYLAWYAAAAVPIVWAGMSGMSGRFSAMAGMLFAWWGFVNLPLVSLIRPIVPRSQTALAVAGIGMFAALLGVRTGGIARSASESVIELAVVASGSLAVSLTVVLLGGRNSAAA